MNVLPEPVVGKLLGAKDDEPKMELAHMSFGDTVGRRVSCSRSFPKHDRSSSSAVRRSR